jgi:hypothetical protein
MKEIKLVGRERTVLRVIDWSLGSTGEELLVATRLEEDDLLDVLNGMIEVGYLETDPYVEKVEPEAFLTTKFEVNPGYAMQLKGALWKGF